MRTSDVFELLRDGTPRTRAQLAATSGLARSTIAARIDVLLRLGLVAPYGGGVSTGGRPPALLALNPRARVVAGVDIGASHGRICLADLAGEVLAEHRESLDVATGPDHVLGWAERQIADLLVQVGRGVGDLAAIGMGLPGPVEHSTGRPVNPPIMPGWDRYDVPGHLQRTYDVPVLIDNDVNIMALGERHEHLAAIEDLIFIKASTGVGAGLISGGQLQRGAQGAAGDLGHVRVARAAGVVCRCGNEGCLEAIAAAPALVRALADEGVEASTGEDVVTLVRQGDLRATRAVRQAGRDLGEVVATLVNVFNPSAVVIGGTLSDAGESLVAGIREVVYQRSLPLATEHLTITTSRSGERAGIIGAAALAIGHVLSPAAIDSAALALDGA